MFGGVVTLHMIIIIIIIIILFAQKQ